MMTDMDEWAFLLNLFVINNPELLKRKHSLTITRKIVLIAVINSVSATVSKVLRFTNEITTRLLESL